MLSNLPPYDVSHRVRASRYTNSCSRDVNQRLYSIEVLDLRRIHAQRFALLHAIRPRPVAGSVRGEAPHTNSKYAYLSYYLT